MFFIYENDKLNYLFHYLFRILEYCLDFLDISLSAIRTIRVMRPLRAVNRIPSKFQFHDMSASLIDYDILYDLVQVCEFL